MRLVQNCREVLQALSKISHQLTKSQDFSFSNIMWATPIPSNYRRSSSYSGDCGIPWT